MNGPAEHFIHQEQRENCSRIWLCNYQSYAKTSSLVMQDLSMPCLTPHVLVQPHSSMGDTPCMWNASSAKWHSIFSQWDRSLVFDKKYQKICLACAHVYVGCDTVWMNIPQKGCTRCRKSACDTHDGTQKYPVCFLKEPLERVTMSKYSTIQYPQLTKNIQFVWYQI